MRSQDWDIDAPAAARLKEAGAVILGKTTTPEFGCKGETNSPLTGLSRNPWNLDKTPGGSSGGTAAAVAAGMGPVSIGTDGAGSIRIPGAFCGNVALKPSFGRVPAYPLSFFGTVSHLGPHTMSVRDAALMMNVLAQPDVRDWHSLPREQRDYTEGLEAGIGGLRVAWSPRLGYARNVDLEVAAACEQAVHDLADLGAHVEAVDPGIEDPLEVTCGLWFVGAWTLWNTLSAAQRTLVSMRTSGPGETELEMRGLTSAGGDSPTVGFYLDDTPLTAPASAQNGKVVIDPSLYDLNRVEVLRGPQGTLYGSGSMGGTIKLVPTRRTRRHSTPPDELIFGGMHGAEGLSSTENFMVNLPVADTLAVRIVGSLGTLTGWIDRIVIAPGSFLRPSVNGTTRGNVAAAPVAGQLPGRERREIRAQSGLALWMPTDRLSIEPSFMYQEITQGGLNLIDSNPGTLTNYQPFDARSRSRTVSTSAA